MIRGLYLPRMDRRCGAMQNKAGIPQKANGSLRPRTNGCESLRKPPPMEWRFGGLERCGLCRWSRLSICLADAGHTFLIDVHKSFVIYGVDPQPKPGPSTRAHNHAPSIRRTEYLSVHSSCKAAHKDWRVYNVRETTRGSLKLRVFLVRASSVGKPKRAKDVATNLLVTELEGQDRKYSLTNQKPRPHTAHVLDAEAAHWVERCPLKMARAGAECRLPVEALCATPGIITCTGDDWRALHS